MCVDDDDDDDDDVDLLQFPMIPKSISRNASNVARRDKYIGLIGQSMDVAITAVLRHVTETAVLTYWHAEWHAQQMCRDVDHQSFQSETIYTAYSRRRRVRR